MGITRPNCKRQSTPVIYGVDESGFLGGIAGGIVWWLRRRIVSGLVRRGWPRGTIHARSRGHFWRLRLDQFKLRRLGGLPLDRHDHGLGLNRKEHIVRTHHIALEERSVGLLGVGHGNAPRSLHDQTVQRDLTGVEHLRLAAPRDS